VDRFERGFGYLNLDHQRPRDPDEPGFKGRGFVRRMPADAYADIPRHDGTGILPPPAGADTFDVEITDTGAEKTQARRFHGTDPGRHQQEYVVDDEIQKKQRIDIDNLHDHVPPMTPL
jgi:hypothetical protein